MSCNSITAGCSTNTLIVIQVSQWIVPPVLSFCPPVLLSPYPPVLLSSCPPDLLFFGPPVLLSPCSSVLLSSHLPALFFLLSSCPFIFLSFYIIMLLSSCPHIFLSFSPPGLISSCPIVLLFSLTVDNKNRIKLWHNDRRTWGKEDRRTEGREGNIECERRIWRQEDRRSGGWKDRRTGHVWQFIGWLVILLMLLCYTHCYIVILIRYYSYPKFQKLSLRFGFIWYYVSVVRVVE